MRNLVIGGLTSVAMLAGVLPAQAQLSAAYPEIAQELRALGPTGPDVPPRTNQLFAPLHAAMPTDGVRVETDKAYGPHERNMLDLYIPEAGGEGAPILIFAHGGGYVRGDKSGVSNVGYYFARNGIVTATINYRFAPDNTWPSGPEDVALVLQWLKDNAEVHGGDIGNIFVSGASAGAAHVAGYVFHEDFQIAEDGVAGAILLSIPSVNLEGQELDPERDALYFGTDQATLAERSVINDLDGREIPLLLAVAEHDQPLVHDQNAQLVAGLYERDTRLPNFLTAQGHNHFSISLHIGTEDENLSRGILEFIAAHTE